MQRRHINNGCLGLIIIIVGRFDAVLTRIAVYMCCSRIYHTEFSVSLSIAKLLHAILTMLIYRRGFD